MLSYHWGQHGWCNRKRGAFLDLGRRSTALWSDIPDGTLAANLWPGHFSVSMINKP